MTVRERMLALRLLEKTAKNPDYAKQIGLNAFVKCDAPEASKVRNEEKCLN